MKENQRVLLIGAGGHAKVIADLFFEAGVELAGCLSPRGSSQLREVPWLGDDAALEYFNPEQYRIHVAIGSNRLRRELTLRIRKAGFKAASAISSRAVISRHARIGAGVAIMAGTVVNSDAYIQAGAIVNTSASVDHDCNIGEFAHLAPGCHLAGTITVGEGAFLGTGASVIPGITIGSWAIIGAGSVVISNIQDNVTAVGVPARRVERRS